MARVLDSIGVQKQLNAMFEQRLDLEKRVLDTVQQELKVALQLQAVMSGLSAEQLAERLTAGAKALEGMADKAAETGDVGANAMKKIADGTKATTASANVAGKALGGVSNVLKGILTSAAGVAGSMLKIGKAVLSIPLAIFKNLMADAAAFVGDTSFMEALEGIRKEFGSFKEDVSKDILGAYRSVNTQLQAMTGLSVWRVFGTPAEQLKYLHEIATKAGAQIHQFGGEIARSGGAIAAFDKGMGIGSENLRGFMTRATVLGTDLQKQLSSTANYALQLGKDFGVSSKVISREVGQMMKDVKNFGSLTQKEMSVATVYTRKLGLEMKDMLGTIDKFDNFDKAAESAALLSQAFGASVDAFKMMNEQNPAKRIDELRQAMAAAGKSTENMSRQELKLLASTTGLSEEAAQLAFSTKNQGLTYAEVEKKAAKAENAQIRQADALQKLADNIERVVRSGGQLQGSFFKMFFAGMERGIKWSQEYRGAMMSVRQALMETFWAGDKVGRSLASSTNVGFGKFMKAFGDTFSPANVKKIMYGFHDAAGKGARGVVAELNAVIGGKQTFSQALTNIRATFEEVAGGARLQEMLAGGKQMMRFLAKGLGSGSAFIAKELVNVLKSVTEFVKDPKEFMKKAGQAAEGSKTFGQQLVSDFASSFGDPKVLVELKKGLIAFGKAVGKQLKAVMKDPEVQKLMLEATLALAPALFGPGLLKALPSIIKPLVGPIMRGFASVGGGALAAATGVALAGAALVNVNKKMDEYEANIDNRFDKASKRAGAYGASLLQGLTLGLLPDNLAQVLAESIAKLADGIFDAIEKQFGGPFTNKLKRYFVGYTDFLGSVGGLIGAVFSGDNAAITAAATDVGSKLVTLVGLAFDFLVTEFPKILLKLSSVLNTVLGSILTSVGDGLTKLGDHVPIVGSAIKGLGLVITGLGELLKDVGKTLDGAFAKAKDFDLSETMSRQLIAIKLSLIDAATFMLDKVPGPFLTMLGLSASGRDAMRVNLEANNKELVANLRSMTEAAVKAAKEAEERTKLAQPSPATPSVSAAAPAAANVKALEDFNEKLQAPAAMAVNVTQGVVKSINELNAVLGDGNSGAMKIGEKLQRFANNSGLGKASSYEIRNKGILLKLDLKVTMDAGEVEKAVLLRKESILFDQLFDKTAGLTNEHQNAIDQVNAMKGGG